MLEVRNLCVQLKQQDRQRTLVEGISFSLGEDQCLGILGESGSGKSVTCSAINGLLGEHFSVSGSVQLRQKELLTLPATERRQLRGSDIAMIMQSPMTAFNPLFTIGNQAVETIRQHRTVDKKAALELICNAMSRVNLKDPQSLLKLYPHELSGGMLQRIMVSFALVLEPKIIIADEPTTAIDYISQREVIRELQLVRETFGTSFIFVSHDLSLISHIADDVLVMNNGQMADYGSAQSVFSHPESEHTRYLIDMRMKLINRFQSVMGS